MTIWLPGYTIVQLGKTGGPYDRADHPKLCWHTTEGGSLAGAETAFAPYPPHLCVDPATGARHQYISLDRCAYSLGNSDAEDSYVIQVEVVGYASESHDWPPERLQWLAEHVAAPVQESVGVPPVPPPQGFHGEGEGIILASSSSPIRFDLAGWDNFAGHVGHQHCPGDDHWDPGRLDIATILGSKPTPQPEEDDMRLYLVVGDNPADGGQWWITDLQTKRYCPSLQHARDTDWWLSQPGLGAGKPLVANFDRDGAVAGPISIRQDYIDAVPEVEP